MGQFEPFPVEHGPEGGAFQAEMSLSSPVRIGKRR